MMSMKHLLFALLIPAAAAAQDLLHQPTGASVPGTMPQAVLDRIDDPFFNIVISADPQPLSLVTTINTMLEGGRSDFESFVVGEQIGRAETVTADCGPSSRRLVISFTGTHAATSTVLAGNVFVAVFLTPSGPVGDLEVMAWDQTNGVYNYYKLEDGTWRFRNSSADLTAAPADVLSDGCLACHVNGGPIMKEFTFPWNHWHSLPNTFEAGYLRPGSQSWPVANSALLGQRLTGAQILEVTIQSSLQRFANTLLTDRIATAADGTVTVSGLKGLIDSLFTPTELNLGSSNVKSGLDGGGLTQRPSGNINIPDSFFVNIMQMRDIELPVFQGQGLVTEVFTPGDLGLTVTEYETLLSEFDISTSCMPGRDTLFAWFGPEPSEFDRRMVERLTRRGIVDDNFVASALAIDVETPLFSDARASMLEHVPDTLSAPSSTGLAKALTEAVVASLAADLDRSEAENDFLSMLQSGDALSQLDSRVRTLAAEAQQNLSDPTRRAEHLRTLFTRLIQNRDAFVSSEISGRQAEFPGLFPLP